MASTLMIVESPAKARKIQSFMGPDFTVKASIGHIRDLPKKALGVNKETLAPTYEVGEGKAQVVAALKRLVKTHPNVILATDPDREGEAIAWHLKVALGIDDQRAKRVTYQEVTKSAIQKAIASPRTIDMNVVAAQEARRVLDRLIGYMVSPELSKRAGTNLSAGRVQSVAVRIVVDRERAIRNFTPTPFFGVSFMSPELAGVKADLVLKPWAEDGKHIWEKECAAQFAGNKKLQLSDIVAKAKTVNPRPPFITVTLQEVAGTLFGYSAADVMKAAQGLFDAGLITYHRTDFPNLSDEGFELAQAYIRSQDLEPSPERTLFKAKGDAQEAHEAIRPTDFSVTEGGNGSLERKVYSLIHERAVTSALAPGKDDLSTLLFIDPQTYPDLQGKQTHPSYAATGKLVRSMGWRSYPKIEAISAKDKPLPSVTKGQMFDGKVSVENQETKPPSRFTEPTLIKAMESAGVGRPATYASIMENVKRRAYIVPQSKGRGSKKGSGHLVPGPHGEYIVDALGGMMFMNIKYTRQVEKTLDEVAVGKLTYLNIVRPVLKTIEGDLLNNLSGDSLVAINPCPKCGEPVLQRSKNKRSFWVHQDDQAGTNCITFLNDDRGAPAIPPPEKESQCPACTGIVVQRTGKYGAFWVHRERETTCEHRFLDDADGSPKIRPPKPPEETSTCLACGKGLVRRYSQKTQQHFWVHQAKRPKCDLKFIDDAEGVPEFPALTAK